MPSSNSREVASTLHEAFDFLNLIVPLRIKTAFSEMTSVSPAALTPDNCPHYSAQQNMLKFP